MHVHILGYGVMAAITGSSAVTCATIGCMSVPELNRRGYPIRQTIGTLAGFGTMGLLIPPSIIIFVYGVSAEQLIDRLFMPERVQRTSWRRRLGVLLRLLSSIGLAVLALGSIYAGVATLTDAAVVGGIGALILSALNRTLD